MRRRETVTLRLPILLVALVAIFAFQETSLRCAEVTVPSLAGTVTFIGDIPKSTVTDDAGVRHDLLEVDRQTRGLRHVVVYLTPAGSAQPSKQPAVRSKGSSQNLMDQSDYAFRPRVLAVQQGEPVSFTNSDPANHNVRTTASNPTNEFNVLTGVDGKYDHRFVLEPGYRPIKAGCDIHPWMRGWIYVFDHPWFAVTDEKGQFRITNPPPGDYLLHVLQPDIGYRENRKLNITKGETAKLDFVIRRNTLNLP